VLPLFVDRLRPVLDDLEVRYEVIAVDDGSRDMTTVLLQKARRDWPQLRLVRLRANAGHQAAISAGLGRGRGDWMVTIDADLQDPPEVIAEMLHIGLQGDVEVIYGVRSDRSTDTAFKRHTASGFYRVMRKLSGVNAPLDAGDFRMMSRATVEAVLSLPAHNRVLRIVIPSLGFPSASVGYKREERAAGESKYPLSKMLRLTLDSVTGYSLMPLRMATFFGLIGFAVAALTLLWAIIINIVGETVAGWTSTLMVVSAFAAVQLLCLGILGEYVGRLFTMSQGRPTFYIAYDSDDADTLGDANW
jgi:dolichol-phosphate mannosyltransferase